MQSTPSQTAERLAYAGLIPFVGGALLGWLFDRKDDLDVHAFVMHGLSVYAATVISFIGALHWGVAMHRQGAVPAHYRWAVTPAVLAWVAALMPAYAGLVMHGALLALCYGVDRQRYPHWGLQAWLTLRFRCTVVASLCCFLAAAAT
jgi:Protein of unknown function (DUF3429)